MFFEKFGKFKYADKFIFDFKNFIKEEIIKLHKNKCYPTMSSPNGADAKK